MNDTDHIDFTPWNNPPKMYADIEEFSLSDLVPMVLKRKVDIRLRGKLI